jgi:hypothetical protein
MVADVVVPFAHEAELELAGDEDDRAPGGAVTKMLCGSWTHQDRCRWPHHTGVIHRGGSRVRIRTVFVADADEEQLVRDRVSTALRAGCLTAPPAPTTWWTLLREGSSALRPDEEPLAAGLAKQ